jgi:prevent-host-death family protein
MEAADKSTAKPKHNSPAIDIKNTPQVVSKSHFKSQLLRYLRKVEKGKQPLIVTHNGKPVVKVTPYHNKEEPDAILNARRNSIVSYKGLDDPVDKNG